MELKQHKWLKVIYIANTVQQYRVQISEWTYTVYVHSLFYYHKQRDESGVH